MAALLNTDVLRQHALPPAFMMGLDAAGGPARDGTVMVGPPTRPRLVATWQLAADGRPVCRWAVSDPAIRGLPPD